LSHVESPHSFLPVGAAHNSHELFDLPALVSLVTGADRVLDTVGHVVTKDFLFKTSQSGTHCRNLRYDINAISVLLNHSRKSSDLSLDTGEALFA
jgi:hypothetical protein